MDNVPYQVVDTIPGHLAVGVRDLLRQCFHSSLTTDEQTRELDDRFCSQGDTYKHALGLDREAVVGLVTAYRRTITYRGRALVLGGLGHVCTDPGRRRSGIATALVQRAMQELRAAGCDLAYLCTDVDDPGMARLYGRFGFVPLGRPHTYLGQSETRYTDSDAMIAPVQSPSIFGEVLADGDPFDIGRGNW